MEDESSTTVDMTVEPKNSACLLTQNDKKAGGILVVWQLRQFEKVELISSCRELHLLYQAYHCLHCVYRLYPYL